MSEMGDPYTGGTQAFDPGSSIEEGDDAMQDRLAGDSFVPSSPGQDDTSDPSATLLRGLDTLYEPLETREEEEDNLNRDASLPTDMFQFPSTSDTLDKDTTHAERHNSPLLFDTEEQCLQVTASTSSEMPGLDGSTLQSDVSLVSVSDTSLNCAQQPVATTSGTSRYTKVSNSTPISTSRIVPILRFSAEDIDESSESNLHFSLGSDFSSDNNTPTKLGRGRERACSPQDFVLSQTGSQKRFLDDSPLRSSWKKRKENLDDSIQIIENTDNRKSVEVIKVVTAESKKIPLEAVIEVEDESYEETQKSVEDDNDFVLHYSASQSTQAFLDSQDIATTETVEVSSQDSDISEKSFKDDSIKSTANSIELKVGTSASNILRQTLLRNFKPKKNNSDSECIGETNNSNNKEADAAIGASKETTTPTSSQNSTSDHSSQPHQHSTPMSQNETPSPLSTNGSSIKDHSKESVDGNQRTNGDAQTSNESPRPTSLSISKATATFICKFESEDISEEEILTMCDPVTLNRFRNTVENIRCLMVQTSPNGPQNSQKDSLSSGYLGDRSSICTQTSSSSGTRVSSSSSGTGISYIGSHISAFAKSSRSSAVSDGKTNSTVSSEQSSIRSSDILSLSSGYISQHSSRSKGAFLMPAPPQLKTQSLLQTTVSEERAEPLRISLSEPLFDTQSICDGLDNADQIPTTKLSPKQKRLLKLRAGQVPGPRPPHPKRPIVEQKPSPSVPSTVSNEPKTESNSSVTRTDFESSAETLTDIETQGRPIKAGSMSFAKWTCENWFYPGKVMDQEEKGDRWKVVFEDGKDAYIQEHNIICVDVVGVGETVHVDLGKLPGLPTYQKAKVYGHRITSRGDYEYVLDLDNGRIREVVQRSQMAFSKEQAMIILEKANPANPSPSRRLVNVSLDNLIIGKRRRDKPQDMYKVQTPTTPQKKVKCDKNLDTSFSHTDTDTEITSKSRRKTPAKPPKKASPKAGTSGHSTPKKRSVKKKKKKVRRRVLVKRVKRKPVRQMMITMRLTRQKSHRKSRRNF